MAIDVFGTARDKHTGWERYAATLARALASRDDLDVAAVGNAHASSNRWAYISQALDHTQRRVADEVRKSHAEVYHATTFPPPIRRLDIPTLWTIHDDLILGGHPEHARAGARIWVTLAKRALRHVDKVATFTHTVADELQRHGVEPSRIALIAPTTTSLPEPEPTSDVVVEDAFGRICEFPLNFVLCVGTFESRKDPATAAAAAAQLNVPIVFVGGASNASRELAPHALFAGRVTDSQLSWLYANASTLITASRYEGVDLPVFEALNAGLPVCASNIDVHQELAGGLVHLFEVGSVVDATSALERALSTPKGAPVALLASPSQTADSYAALYRELI